MKKVIFLDLENTIILSWDDFLNNPYNGLINEKSIRKYLKSINCKEIRIFSHAIYDCDDLRLFHRDMCRMIEILLNVKVVHVETVINLIVQQRLGNMTASAYCRMFSKTDSFTRYLETQSDSNTDFEYVLIDDEVVDKRLNCVSYEVEFINIKSILREY